MVSAGDAMLSWSVKINVFGKSYYILSLRGWIGTATY